MTQTNRHTKARIWLVGELLEDLFSGPNDFLLSLPRYSQRVQLAERGVQNHDCGSLRQAPSDASVLKKNSASVPVRQGQDAPRIRCCSNPAAWHLRLPHAIAGEQSPSFRPCHQQSRSQPALAEFLQAALMQDLSW